MPTLICRGVCQALCTAWLRALPRPGVTSHPTTILQNKTPKLKLVIKPKGNLSSHTSRTTCFSWILFQSFVLSNGNHWRKLRGWGGGVGIGFPGSWQGALHLPAPGQVQLIRLLCHLQTTHSYTLSVTHNVYTKEDVLVCFGLFTT